MVLIQSATRFDSAVASIGVPLAGTRSRLSIQYGVKPVSQHTAAGRTRLV